MGAFDVMMYELSFCYSKSQGMWNSTFFRRVRMSFAPMRCHTPARAYDCSDHPPVINRTQTHLYSANIALMNIAPPCIGPKPTIQMCLQ